MREPSAPEAPRRAGPWRNLIPVLGITDDEVLNMPGWGRPSSIARTRLARGWREVWTYNQPTTGPRELHFTNARLSEIVRAAAGPNRTAYVAVIAASGTCAYMFETRPPIGMQPATSSASTRQRRILTRDLSVRARPKSKE